VLIAFDKFKHALDAPGACAAAARGVRARYPKAICDECPLSDGGEGFANLLTRASHGLLFTRLVAGPLGNVVRASYGLVSVASVPPRVRARIEPPASPWRDSDHVAVVEMAAASGLALVPAGDRDPLRSSSAGTGELLRAVARPDVVAILLGVGGSATSDLGLGALTEVGYKFHDAAGGRVIPLPQNWSRITRITGSAPPQMPPVFIACDVVNPLCGPNGAAAVYGPQKGLALAAVPRVDAEAARLARMVCEYRQLHPDLPKKPGAGAAGGIAFGLMAGLGAQLLPGAELVGDWFELAQRIQAADVVLTGEGSFDGSSLAGKGPGAVVVAGRAAGKPVHVFAGRFGLPQTAWMHPVTPANLSLDEALSRTAQLIERAVAETCLSAM